MRKIIAGFASSLDGYIEGSNGEYDWILIDEEIDFAEQMKRYDAYLFGRNSYERFRGANDLSFPGMEYYVISNTLTESAKPFKLISGDIKEQIEELKQKEGKDIAVFGGASLLSSLLDMQLVDEISVAVIPILIGKGKPMINVVKQHIPLQLTNAKTYKNGTVQLEYQVVK